MRYFPYAWLSAACSLFMWFGPQDASAAPPSLQSQAVSQQLTINTAKITPSEFGVCLFIEVSTPLPSENADNSEIEQYQLRYRWRDLR